ncbi:MAG: hypothetical protein ACLFRX_06820 [Gemmatimonadota bacterium]
MAENRTIWRQLDIDGAVWEARVVPGSERTTDRDEAGEVLEFVCVDGTRKSRRLAVSRGAVKDLDEAGLRRAYTKARPIGGDHYGRPGKPPNDLG